MGVTQTIFEGMENIIFFFIFMDPCIAIQLSINNQQDATW